MSALDLSTLPLFIVATLVICVAPGPDMIYMTGTGLSGGRRAAVLAGFGVTLGVSVYVFATAFGLAAVAARLPVVLVALQVFGAVYLLYLAWSTIRESLKGSGAETMEPDQDADQHWFRRGLVVNLTNPKPMLFFLAFLPQFIGRASSPTMQLIMLGLVFQVISLAIDLAIGLAAGTLRQQVLGRPGVVRGINFASAVVFVGLAVFIVVDLLGSNGKAFA